MEVFSLEDDDYGDTFITQTPSSDSNVELSQENQILGDPMDFQSPCLTVLNKDNVVTAQYSDISDTEDFNIPSSQPISHNAR